MGGSSGKGVPYLGKILKSLDGFKNIEYLMTSVVNFSPKSAILSFVATYKLLTIIFK